MRSAGRSCIWLDASVARAACRSVGHRRARRVELAARDTSATACPRRLTSRCSMPPSLSASVQRQQQYCPSTPARGWFRSPSGLPNLVAIHRHGCEQSRRARPFSQVRSLPLRRSHCLAAQRYAHQSRAFRQLTQRAAKSVAGCARDADTGDSPLLVCATAGCGSAIAAARAGAMGGSVCTCPGDVPSPANLRT